MIKIEISSRKFSFSMDIDKKITFIRGHSGKGKTIFSKAVSDISGAYKKYVSDTSYELLAVPDSDWYSYLASNIESGRKCIYVIDDADYIITKEFADLFSQDKHSYYILINRLVNLSAGSLGQLPYSVNDVYDMHTDGKRHWLSHSYSQPSLDLSSSTVLVVEDAGAGNDFFSSCFSSVISAGGKDKIADLLQNLHGKVLLMADMAALGSNFDLILQTANQQHINLLYTLDYLSFEYFLLSSRMFSIDINHISNSYIAQYISHEDMYFHIITEKTANTPYQYSKEHLSSCYVKDCCDQSRDKKPCAVGIKGNKLVELFKATKFETLMNKLLETSSIGSSHYFNND